jgi:hypothetical protein
MSNQRQDFYSQLNLASLQHDDFMKPVLSGHDMFSVGVSPLKSGNLNVSWGKVEPSSPATKDNNVSNVKDEVSSMVAALEVASAISRAEAQDAGDYLLASSTNVDSIYEPMRKINNPRPPMRFHRRGALWASITRLMLCEARRSARSTLCGPLLPFHALQAKE